MGLKRIASLLLCLAAPLVAQTINYTYDPAGRLIAVSYSNGKVLSYTYDSAGNLLRRLVIVPVSGPAPVASAAGVVNAASFLGGPVAPGELVTIFGSGIGPAVLASAGVSSLGSLTTTCPKPPCCSMESQRRSSTPVLDRPRPSFPIPSLAKPAHR